MNRAPIFINAFARGGSSLVESIIRSHPDVCVPRGELHQAFRGRKGEPLRVKLNKRLRYLPLFIAFRGDIFSPHRLVPLVSDDFVPSPFVAGYIDSFLHHSKMTARHPFRNKYKREGEEYTPEEIRAARLACKNVNGVALLTPLFRKIYPDSVFIAVVRHGLAICEGHIRRGLMTARECGRLYQVLGERMLAERDALPNYHLVKYEDIVRDPATAIRDLYGKLGLDPNAVPKIAIITKPVLNTEGKHAFVRGTDKQLIWLTPAELEGYLQKDLNARQIAQLGRPDRESFMEAAGVTLRKLGYQEDA